MEAGTEHGTIISAIAISVSIFISLAVMTLVALAGNFILSLLPDSIIAALNYLLPALFGAMCMQRIMMDYKSAFVLLPCALIIRYLSTLGVFKVLPFGGGYAPHPVLRYHWCGCGKGSAWKSICQAQSINELSDKTIKREVCYYGIQ